FWEVRGPFREGRRWLEQALHFGGTTGASAEFRLRALLGMGRIALWQADLDAALGAFEQSLPLARRLDDPLLQAEALTWLGTTYRRQGALDRAEVVLRDGLALHEALDDRSGAAWALFNLGHIPMHRFEWPRARPFCEAALAHYRALGDVR